jgi:hypothetical protein
MTVIDVSGGHVPVASQAIRLKALPLRSERKPFLRLILGRDSSVNRDADRGYPSRAPKASHTTIDCRSDESLTLELVENVLLDVEDRWSLRPIFIEAQEY